MKHYTVGFLFNNQRSQVLLIEKTHPEWQKGRLNGIGGKRERGESYEACLIREFQEETGIKSNIPDWENFVIYQGPDYVVRFYRAFSTEYMLKARSTTEEKIVRRELDKLPPVDSDRIIWNLRWLLPLALDNYVKQWPVIVTGV